VCRHWWRLEPGDRWVSSFLPHLSCSLLRASLSSLPWESWESSEVLSPEAEEEEEEEEEEEGEEVESREPVHLPRNRRWGCVPVPVAHACC